VFDLGICGLVLLSGMEDQAPSKRKEPSKKPTLWSRLTKKSVDGAAAKKKPRKGR
tara:strand:+ start:773 stop:937 length:165 start_codon:yes stop_codon:yes gene_type:complete